MLSLFCIRRFIEIQTPTQACRAYLQHTHVPYERIVTKYTKILANSGTGTRLHNAKCNKNLNHKKFINISTILTENYILWWLYRILQGIKILAWTRNGICILNKAETKGHTYLPETLLQKTSGWGVAPSHIDASCFWRSLLKEIGHSKR